MSETDIEKLRSFFDIADENGVTNGDKLLEHTRQIPDLTPYWYDPADIDPVLKTEFFWIGNSQFGNDYIVDISFMVYHYYDHWIITPELVGEFDLSGTSLCNICYRESSLLPDGITGINLNDCSSLYTVVLSGRNSSQLESFTALNCFDLTKVSLVDLIGLRSIQLQSRRFSEPIEAFSFGAGCVNIVLDTAEYTLTAHEGSGRFIGWFKDGQKISSEEELAGASGEGTRVFAAFFGDVNSDDDITIADAILLARGVIGVGSDCPLSSGDVNLDGRLDIQDAVILMRFAIGIA